LVDRHIERATRVAMRITRHREDAEDIVQDAFLSALRHIDDFDPNRAFWPWLARIVVNRGLDVRAPLMARNTESLPDEVEDAGDSPADHAERSDVMEQFKKALALLPPRRRTVLELFELEQFSVAEIASMLGSPAATIRWHLHAARKELRGSLSHLKGEGR